MLALVVLVLTALGACSSQEEPIDQDERSRRTYRVEIEPIVLAEPVPTGEASALAVLPAGGLAWTVDVDANRQLARFRGTVPWIIACPSIGSNDDLVELEIIQTRTEILSRSDGCGGEADRWRSTPGAIDFYLLIPAQLDLEDPGRWLEQAFDRPVDEDLRIVIDLDCVGNEQSLCADLAAAGADPAILLDAGVEQLVLDVDLDPSGRVATMRLEMTERADVAAGLAGLGGADYRIFDYGAPIDIQVPQVDG